MGMVGACAVPEQGLGKGPQQALLLRGTLMPAVGLLPGTAWLCILLSLHSQDALGDALGDKSPFFFFFTPQMFMNYLQPSDQVDIILMAIKSMRTPSAYSISMAAYMVNVLVAESTFRPRQVSSPWVAGLMLQPTGGLFLPQLRAWPAPTPSRASTLQWKRKQLPVGVNRHAHPADIPTLTPVSPPGAGYRVGHLQKPALPQGGGSPREPEEGPAEAGGQTPR